jgi:hypothetical protein
VCILQPQQQQQPHPRTVEQGDAPCILFRTEVPVMRCLALIHSLPIWCDDFLADGRLPAQAAEYGSIPSPGETSITALFNKKKSEMQTCKSGLNCKK